MIITSFDRNNSLTMWKFERKEAGGILCTPGLRTQFGLQQTTLWLSLAPLAFNLS